MGHLFRTLHDSSAAHIRLSSPAYRFVIEDDRLKGIEIGTLSSMDAL